MGLSRVKGPVLWCVLLLEKHATVRSLLPYVWGDFVVIEDASKLP